MSAVIYLNELKLAGRKYNLINFNYKSEKERDIQSIEAIHHIHVIDRSHSMTDEIDKLIDNVIETFNHISEKDLISVIWFSGHDECSILFKGATIHSKDMIIKKLNSIRSCVGITCFSEPIKKVEEVIMDLKDICDNFNVCFFTDGQVVTPWSETEEKERIFTSLQSIKDNHGLLALNTIGYGNWYDEELLNKMTEYSVFGHFNHSNNINDYSKIFTHEYEKIKDNVLESCEITADENTEIMYITPRDSKLYKGTFKTKFINKIKNQFFLITEGNKFTINGEEYDIESIKTKRIPKPSLMNFLYSYAKELYIKGEQHLAIDVLAYTKDKAVIDKAMSSFTRDERAEVITLLASCYTSNKNRFKSGEAPDNYIPSPKAYNVIQFLAELANKRALYLPVENYNRIGKVVKDVKNLFVKDDSVEVIAPMDELIFNEKKLNVSIRYMMKGFVNLDPQVAQTVN